MKTTKKQATIMWKIAEYIDPYNLEQQEKKQVIEEYTKREIEENLEAMQDYILCFYDNEAIIKESPRLVIMLGELYKDIEKEKGEKKND